ncbi:MAG: molybdate ABC transporter substrate-binding protein [Pseudomonadota bacterium]
MRWCVKAALFSIAFALVNSLLLSGAQAADVTVFAAVSLKEAMDEQVKKFQGGTTHKVTVSYAGSNSLARQIEAGAPADLFISADVDWMDYLEMRNLLMPNTRINLLRNRLVLIAPVTNTASLKITPNFKLAAALGTERLAMANPGSVPAGKYGKAALETLGVWSSVEKQVVRAENVRAALALVSRGEAAYGIVYSTDALADKKIRVVDIFPEETHSPIFYSAAVIATGKSAAKPLLDYLHSNAASTIWEQYGFRVVQ